MLFGIIERKKIQNVHRVEDLQVGDEIQYDIFGNRCEIVQIMQINDKYYDIQIEGITPGNITQTRSATHLHRDQKVFVWR